MIGACVKRGLLAGLIAGLLAGFFGLVAGGPAIDAAIAIESSAAVETAVGQPADETLTVSRGLQKFGLVAATSLYGLGVGAVFGVASAWAVGRLSGTSWSRSLKLGAVAVASLVLLPAVKYAPNPPAVGDPSTVGTRTGLYLGLGVCALLLATAAWTGMRSLRAAGLSAPVAEALAGLGALAAATALLVALPTVGSAGAFPADLLWQFRLSSLGTQVVLYAGTAVVFGLIADRAERRATRVPQTTP